MAETSKQQKISGHVSWDQSENPSEQQKVGPLTGKPMSEDLRKGRSRKSESAFRTISEVADMLDVQQHVLRFWETKFSQVRPLKRGGGRRYYRPEDVELLKSIHHLLYTEKYTIKGVQKLLREQGKKAVLESAHANDSSNAGTDSAETAGKNASVIRAGLTNTQRSLLEATLVELKSLRSMVE